MTFFDNNVSIGKQGCLSNGGCTHLFNVFCEAVKLGKQPDTSWSTSTILIVWFIENYFVH